MRFFVHACCFFEQQCLIGTLGLITASSSFFSANSRSYIDAFKVTGATAERYTILIPRKALEKSICDTSPWFITMQSRSRFCVCRTLIFFYNTSVDSALRSNKLQQMRTLVQVLRMTYIIVKFCWIHASYSVKRYHSNRLVFLSHEGYLQLDLKLYSFLIFYFVSR